MNDSFLELVNFAPLIQFLAGVYLLFLYERFFREFPLLTHLNSIQKEVNEFALQYQGYFDVSSNSKINTPFFGKYWDNDWGLLRRIITMSFFFCVFILCYIGFENYDYENLLDFHYSILVVSTFVFIYILLCFLIGKQKKFLHPFFWMLFMLFSFYFSRPINHYLVSNGLILFNMSITCTTIYILITTIFGFIVIGFKSYTYYCKNKLCNNKTKALSNDVNVMLSANMMANNHISSKATKALLDQRNGNTINIDAAINYLVATEIETISKDITAKEWKAIWNYWKYKPEVFY